MEKCLRIDCGKDHKYLVPHVWPRTSWTSYFCSVPCREAYLLNPRGVTGNQGGTQLPETALTPQQETALLEIRRLIT
jgi:hypothetical protein